MRFLTALRRARPVSALAATLLLAVTSCAPAEVHPPARVPTPAPVAAPAPAPQPPPRYPSRPPPPSPRVGEPVETDDYRITVTRFVECGHTAFGESLVGVEVMVENFGKAERAYPARARIFDEGEHEYRQSYAPQGPCEPGLADSEENKVVAPGARASGFLRPVVVPRDAKALVLRYAPGGDRTREPAEEHRLPLGQFPDPARERPWLPPDRRDVVVPSARIEVTSVRVCEGGSSGHGWLGVELLIENRSGAPLIGNPKGILEDAAHYRHETEMNGALTRCTPDVGNTFHLAPGGKVRGWLWLFDVDLASGPWTLHYDVEELAPPWSSTTVDLPVGNVAAAPSR